MCQTRGRVSLQDFQTPRTGLKNEAQLSLSNSFRGVWISDETLFRVFDIASQTDHKCGENEGIKSSKSMQTTTGYPNFLHSSDVLCVLVMNFLTSFRSNFLNTRNSVASGFSNTEKHSIVFLCLLRLRTKILCLNRKL